MSNKEPITSFEAFATYVNLLYGYLGSSVSESTWKSFHALNTRARAMDKGWAEYWGALISKKESTWPTMRELSRFERETYHTIPESPAWDAKVTAIMRELAFAPHFVHVSTEHRGLVAYTASEVDAVRDRRVREKLGRYLTKYHSDKLSSAMIADIANRFTRAHVTAESVVFLRTGDEIEHAYKHGPDSCMAHDASDYAANVYPVRAYESPDFALAVMKDSRDESRIVARAVVNTKDMLFHRSYGNEILPEFLKTLGYSQTSAFAAECRLKCLRQGDNYIGPYIDGVDHTIYHDGKSEYLYIGKVPEEAGRGWFSIGSCQLSNDTRGFLNTTESSEEECAECGEYFDVDSMNQMPPGMVCSTCLDTHWVEAHTPHGSIRNYRWTRVDDAISAEDGSLFVTDLAAITHGYHFVNDGWYHENVLRRNLDGEYTFPGR